MTVTHETFIHAVAQAARDYAGPEHAAKLDGIKLVYGAGKDGIRGITYYNRWKGADGQEETKPFVELGAFTQRDWVQVAGTTIHELAHVLAGWEAGHGPVWKAATETLGLRRMKAAGTNYCLAHFAPTLRDAISRMDKPADGAPVCGLDGAMQYIGTRKGKLNIKGCAAGIGTKGGKSRGAGSGSRLRLWECAGEGHKPYKVRIATDDFQATCDCCKSAFRLGGYNAQGEA